MKPPADDTISAHCRDKQLEGITLEAVLAKRRLDQALNAKEFAVSAGVSYSTARSWFHLPGFPVFHGVVFWQDFVQWRAIHNTLADEPASSRSRDSVSTPGNLPPRAARLLLEDR